MEYFNLLEFKKEPFSNSPEPEFLFASSQHSVCLQKLELAVRLRRGLNVVIGAVGTGKTTLCRKLIQNLSGPDTGDVSTIETYLLLDPGVESRLEFVKTVAGLFGMQSCVEDNEWHLKEKIKKYLFEKGVDEQKTVALIIDEGQKIPDDCLEILREFLNYETNNFKLLQIIIFAQPELSQRLSSKENLLDRVNDLCYLKPLSFHQMKSMIQYRITVASQKPDHHSLLSFGGVWAVYLATAGYPRKVVSLCHQIVLMMIIKGKSKAGWFLVRSCVPKITDPGRRRVIGATLCMILIALLVFAGILYIPKNSVQSIGEEQRRLLSGVDFKKESITAPVQILTDQHSVKAIPESLGTIKLKKRMTIWRILENIYGDSGEEIQSRFAQVNPQIKDMNNTTEGEIIHVPAISGASNLLAEKTILVSLECSDELTDIYHAFVTQKSLASDTALMFMSIWNEKNGKQFFIALDKHFRSSQEAQKAIDQLPPELAGSARILTQWEKGTIVFNRRFLKNDTDRNTEGG